MVTLEQLAEAALARDTLHLRSLTQDWLTDTPELSLVPLPASQDARLQVMAAALVELLARRRSQEPPAWAATIGALTEPFFLLEAALTMRRLRQLCEIESPEPLRRRKLYAPPNFLEFA